MKDFVNSLFRYAYLMWLGGAAYLIFGASVTDWRYWVLIVPTAVIETMSRRESEGGTNG